MKLGLGSYAFTWAIGIPGHAWSPVHSLTPLDLLKEADRLGTRVLQLCDNLPLTRLSAHDLDIFEAEAGRCGICIEVGTRGLDASDLRAQLALAVRFRSPFVRVVPGHEPGADTPEGTARRLGEVLPEFADHGVRIALENHDRMTSGELAGLVETLGPDRVGICLDTVNSFGALEGPEVVVERLAPFTCCLHVKDFTIRRVEHQMGFVIEGCAAGQGRLHVPWLLDRLQRDAPGPFNAILECWVTPEATLEATIARETVCREASLAYLRPRIPKDSAADPDLAPDTRAHAAIEPVDSAPQVGATSSRPT